LHRLSFVPDPNLLAGVGDDAAVYRLREDLAIVVSVDYFTPIVKEAYLYGQIAAANALSDIYAMGAKPIIALNIVCFPVASMDLLMLEEVLRGSSDKLKEAGVLLVGGHTVIDPKEIKYGLSVTGIVDPKRMLTKGGLKVGDKLILTKALGTGIINNALKGGMLDAETEMEIAQSMAALNKRASEVAQEAGAHACTDVTGFGLVGHLLEMIRESEDVGIEIDFSSLPLFSRVEEFAEAGLIPSGSQRNRKYYQEKISFSENIPEWKRWIVFDAQTSGGLILSIPGEETDRLLERLHKEGVGKAAVTGHVVEEPRGKIVVELNKNK
jgi:selenide, water dikinase